MTIDIELLKSSYVVHFAKASGHVSIDLDEYYVNHVSQKVRLTMHSVSSLKEDGQEIARLTALSGRGRIVQIELYTDLLELSVMWVNLEGNDLGKIDYRLEFADYSWA